MINPSMRIPIEQPNYGLTDSLVKIDGRHLPAGSCRNISMSFEKRTFGTNEIALDGGLLFLGMPGLGKRFDFTISGEGLFAPNLFELDPWDRVLVESCEPFCQFGQVQPADFMRPHVPGSIRYMGMVQLANGEWAPRTLALEGEPVDPRILWTFYRPILWASPESASFEGQEWEKAKSWEWNFKDHLDPREM